MPVSKVDVRLPLSSLDLISDLAETQQLPAYSGEPRVWPDPCLAMQDASRMNHAMSFREIDLPHHFVACHRPCPCPCQLGVILRLVDGQC